MGRQRIPRPPRWRLGDPPPWSAVPAEQRRHITTAKVRTALERVGPSQPWGRAGPVELGDESLPAAVLVALFEDADEAHVVLTRRSSNLRAHTGEVSFPGGRLDPGEEPVSAALREATEEVGLDPNNAE